MRAVEALQMDGKRDECPEVDSLDDADPTRRVGIRAYSNPCRQSWRDGQVLFRPSDCSPSGNSREFARCSTKALTRRMREWPGR
jgi:hypothetical protein